MWSHNLCVCGLEPTADLAHQIAAPSKAACDFDKVRNPLLKRLLGQRYNTGDNAVESFLELLTTIC